MYFWTYGLRKTSLGKCLKSLILEHSPTSNMVNEPKHNSKSKDSTFTIFIDTSDANSGWKSLY